MMAGLVNGMNMSGQKLQSMLVLRNKQNGKLYGSFMHLNLTHTKLQKNT